MSLRLGLIPIADESLGDQFAEAISEIVREQVTVHRSADYRGLEAALHQGAVQMAWVPPLVASRLMHDRIIEPLLITVRSGAASYQTCLYTLKKSPIVSLDTLRDARAAWVDRESASGYLVIRAALRSRGIMLARAFSTESFFRSHAEVARAVASGQVDVGATFFSRAVGSDTIERAGWREGNLSDDSIRVIVEGGPIPADLFAVASQVGTAKLRPLQHELLQNPESRVAKLACKLMRAEGFVLPSNDHRSLLRHLHEEMDKRTSLPPPMV